MVTADFSRSASSVLKDNTKEVHDEISQSEGAFLLANGKLDKPEYVTYLMMLWHIYSVLESGLEKHANHPILSPTYNPALFSRLSCISADISYFLGLPDDDSSWKSSSIYKQFIASPPNAFLTYVGQLANLSSEEPARLLAHSYVRYLGDLSGGQMIKRELRKAFATDDNQDVGFTFYNFQQLGTEGMEMFGGTASIGDMKKIKDWFKEGMNKGIGDDPKLKETLLDETRKAYELNAALLATLRPPAKEEAFISSEKIPVEVPKEGTTYPVASVLAFMLAVGLTHFILVVGGFTGEKGYAKLELVQRWYTEFMTSFQ